MSEASFLKTMRASLVLLGLCLAAVAGAPSTTASPLTIVGGNLTTIEHYPFQVALLFEVPSKDYGQGCGGSIINNRSILTAAHCVLYKTDAQRRLKDLPNCSWSDETINLFSKFTGGSAPSTIRVRVGSSFANSGGVIHNVEKYMTPNQNESTQRLKDFAIVRLATPISFNKQAEPATLADTNYNLGDNQTVWAAGWGCLWYLGPTSEQLRHVQIWTVNQAVCNDHYAGFGCNVTDDMLCAGWLGVGGRGSCHGDSGGPLVHNGVVVGVTSWGKDCALADYPTVYARVSRSYDWIQANA